MGFGPPGEEPVVLPCLYCEPGRDIVDDPVWASRARGGVFQFHR